MISRRIASISCEVIKLDYAVFAGHTFWQLNQCAILFGIAREKIVGALRWRTQRWQEEAVGVSRIDKRQAVRILYHLEFVGVKTVLRHLASVADCRQITQRELDMPFMMSSYNKLQRDNSTTLVSVCNFTARHRPAEEKILRCIRWITAETMSDRGLRRFRVWKKTIWRIGAYGARTTRTLRKGEGLFDFCGRS
jgi:hypothetical protein